MVRGVEKTLNLSLPWPTRQNSRVDGMLRVIDLRAALARFGGSPQEFDHQNLRISVAIRETVSNATD